MCNCHNKINLNLENDLHSSHEGFIMHVTSKETFMTNAVKMVRPHEVSSYLLYWCRNVYDIII